MDDKNVGLNHQIPPDSAGNLRLRELFNAYYEEKYANSSAQAFPTYLNIFYYMLPDVQALARPFEANKMTSTSFDLSSVQADISKIVQTTANHLKGEMQKAGISFDNLQYSEGIISSIAVAFAMSPTYTQLIDEFDAFFKWCDECNKDLDVKFRQEILKNLIAGIATNAVHLIQAELGRTHPAGYFMEKVLLKATDYLTSPEKVRSAGENQNKLMKQEIVEAVVESTKFPTNMNQFKDYLSKDYPLNKNKAGKDFNNINKIEDFVSAVKEALIQLEVNANFLMLEAKDQQVEIKSFLNQLKVYGPKISPENQRQIEEAAKRIGQLDGFISRHLAGHTGVVNALEQVKLEDHKQAVIKSLDIYLKELKKNSYLPMFSNRIDYIEKLFKQLEDTTSNPYWFVELMNYDQPDFENSPLGSLCRNEAIKKDLPDLVDMLEALRKTGEAYLVKNLKLDEKGLKAYFQHLKTAYLKNPPAYDWHVTTVVREAFGFRKESVVEERLNEAQLAPKIKAYVESEEFSKALEQIPAWRDFIKDIRDRYVEIKSALDSNERQLINGKNGYEYLVLKKIKKFLKSVDVKENIFQNAMLIRDLDGNLDILKEEGGLNNIVNSGGDGQIFRMFDKLFPREENEALILIDKEKRFGMELTEGLDELWRKARMAIVDQVAQQFPQQSKEGVTAGINYLLDPGHTVEKDNKWQKRKASPRDTSSSSAQISSSSVTSSTASTSDPTPTVVSSSSSSAQVMPNFPTLTVPPQATTRRVFSGVFSAAEAVGNMGMIASQSKIPGASAEQMLAEKIRTIINHKDFRKVLLFTCFDEYRRFIGVLSSLSNVKAGSALSTLQKTQSPIEFFLVLMGEEVKKEIMAGIKAKNISDKILQAHTKLRDALVEYMRSDKRMKAVDANQISKAVDIIISSPQQPKPVQQPQLQSQQELSTQQLAAKIKDYILSDAFTQEMVFSSKSPLKEAYDNFFKIKPAVLGSIIALSTSKLATEFFMTLMSRDYKEEFSHNLKNDPDNMSANSKAYESLLNELVKRVRNLQGCGSVIERDITEAVEFMNKSVQNAPSSSSSSMRPGSST